ncbi:MAG: CCA tRNA nucleotidyltransferase [Alphaproteobacteria bacterium]
MQPSGRTIEQAWLTADGAAQVTSALMAKGGVVRFVGGCVRDALLGIDVRDIDLATDQPPETVISLLEDAGLRAIPTGIDHGTVTAVAKGRPFEITTLRRDVETHGRHATVAFTDDWAEDAKRRDFTINALYCDPDGQVFDPVDGLPDLDAGRVRFVGDPIERIEEDALRILRFFRFHAWFATGELDGPARKACITRKDDLDRLSVERVSKEMLRLLEAARPIPTLHAMQDDSILRAVLPEGTNLCCLEQLIEFGGQDPLLRLASLTDRRSTTLQALGARWKLSNADKNRLRCMAAGEIALPPDMDAATVRAQLYWLGAQRVCDLACLDAARDGRDRRTLLQIARQWERPDFPLRGADVIALGVAPGERIGHLLAEIEDEWVSDDFAGDRHALLRRLRSAVEAD